VVQIHSPRPLFQNQRFTLHENPKSAWPETMRPLFEHVGREPFLSLNSSPCNRRFRFATEAECQEIRLRPLETRAHFRSCFIFAVSPTPAVLRWRKAPASLANKTQRWFALRSRHIRSVHERRTHCHCSVSSQQRRLFRLTKRLRASAKCESGRFGKRLGYIPRRNAGGRCSTIRSRRR
jgi:hypothetical protein